MNYLSVKPLVLSNTLSHMWDRLNLPMLLFKEGLLNVNSNIALLQGLHGFATLEVVWMPYPTDPFDTFTKTLTFNPKLRPTWWKYYK